jgi:hypothetical protein
MLPDGAMLVVEIAKVRDPIDHGRKTIVATPGRAEWRVS